MDGLRLDPNQEFTPCNSTLAVVSMDRWSLKVVLVPHPCNVSSPSLRVRSKVGKKAVLCWPGIQGSSNTKGVDEQGVQENHIRQLSNGYLPPDNA